MTDSPPIFNNVDLNQPFQVDGVSLTDLALWCRIRRSEDSTEVVLEFHSSPSGDQNKIQVDGTDSTLAWLQAPASVMLNISPRTYVGDILVIRSEDSREHLVLPFDFTVNAGATW